MKDFTRFVVTPHPFLYGVVYGLPDLIFPVLVPDDTLVTAAACETHIWVQTGMAKSWCKACDCDGVWDRDLGKFTSIKNNRGNTE